VLDEIGDLADPDVRHAVEGAVVDPLEDDRSSDALVKGLAA
jgi:hypothetical protein